MQNATIDNTAQPRSTRRQWLKRTLAAGFATAAATVVDTFWIEPFWLDIVTRDLAVANLPPRWQGKRIAHFSDLHVGHQVSSEFLTQCFDHVADYAPEIVVYTGDFVTASPSAQVPWTQLAQVMRRAPRGTVSSLGILGNHDYGRSWADHQAADRMADFLSQQGLQILRNQKREVDGLEIIGLDDLWAGRCDGHSVLTPSAPAVAQLTLCHNPDAADREFWSGYRGWILAGHTHGGQCKPPFLPPPLLPVVNRRYTSGDIDLLDGRRLYISRGLGHLLRARFNCRPEVTLFRLTIA